MTAPLFPGLTFRPWNVDALATIVAVTPKAIVIRYDHDEAGRHAFTPREFEACGRIVDRREYGARRSPQQADDNRRRNLARLAERARVAAEKAAGQYDPTEARLRALSATAGRYHKE